MKLLVRNLPLVLLFCIVALLSSFAIKGEVGNPFYFQVEKDERVGGPFESTFSNSRYALVEAIVENKTFFFTDEQAKFSAPDISYYNGNYFSIFTPGVSFLAMPLYFVGRALDLPQLFTFLLNPIIGLVNVYLIMRLSLRLGAKKYESMFAGVVFLFATNALVYATTLSQHHASVMVILLGLLNALDKERVWKNNIWFGIVFGLGVMVDIPNAFILLPALFLIASRHLELKKLAQKYTFSIKTSFLGLLTGLIPLVAIFMIYNYKLTGSPVELGQTIGRTDYPYVEPSNKSEQIIFSSELARKFTIFDTRRQLLGFYELLLSDERGVIFYYPVVLLGLLGFATLYKKNKDKIVVSLYLGTMAMTLILYSMHADPWGGWAFGSRYFLPISAILTVGLAVQIQHYKKNILFICCLFVLLIYSVIVNTAGLLTTTAVPPKVEAVNLPDPIPYTYEYNFQLLDKGKNGSLLHNVHLDRYLTAYQTYYLVLGLFLATLTSSYIFVLLERNKTK